MPPSRGGSRSEEPAVARPGSTRERGNAPVSGAPRSGAGWRDQGPPTPGTGLRRRFQHVYVQGGGAAAPPGEPPCPLASLRWPAGLGAPALGRRGRGHGRAGFPGRTTGRHLRTFWKCFPLLSWLALRREDRRETGEEQLPLPKPASPESTNNQGPAVQERP